MPKQPEAILEEQLIAQLQKLGYGLVLLNDEHALINNLKTQLEKHNQIEFTAKEFERVLNLLSKGSVFEKAKTLREKQHIVRDNGDNLYFEFINIEHWCQNEFQVTQQVSMKGKCDFVDQWFAIGANRIETSGIGTEGSLQSDQPLPASFFRVQCGLIPVHSNLCDKQWCEY